MARTERAQPDMAFVAQGLTTEFDAAPNRFNPAVQWVGSGVMEWIGKLLFADVAGTAQYYPTMIAAGEQVPPGADGIRLQGNFAAAEDLLGNGRIIGLSMHHSRAQIYRAALEYMALQLKNGLNVLQQVSHFNADSLICVGGGSKNRLWNQIRADVLNLPLDIVDVAESTVLGAAMFTFAGIGVYASAEQAQCAMRPRTQRIYPSPQAADYRQWLAQIK